MQQMLERGTPLGIDPTVVLLRGLNFGVEHLYLDPSPNNEAGAGYFMFGPPGGEQMLLVQVGAKHLASWLGRQLQPVHNRELSQSPLIALSLCLAA